MDKLQLTTYSDLDLINLIVNENHSQAFQVLYQRYEPIVLRLNYTYQIKHFSLDDIKQEGRMMLFLSCKTFNPSRYTYFGAYFKVVYRNHLFSLLRQEKRRYGEAGKAPLSLDAIQEEALNQGHHGYQVSSPSRENPDQAYTVNQQIKQYLNSLSEMESEVFKLYSQGINLEHTAMLLACRENDVRNALSRCRLKMKNLLM